MPREPLERYEPSKLAAELGTSWPQLTEVQLLERTAGSELRRHLVTVAHWASVWSAFDAAIAERCRDGATLTGIAQSAGLSAWGLGLIRSGRVWPDTLTLLRLADVLDIELRTQCTLCEGYVSDAPDPEEIPLPCRCRG